jgi:hypothetical protein
VIQKAAMHGRCRRPNDELNWLVAKKSRTYDIGLQSKADGVAAAGVFSAVFADRCSSQACDPCSFCRNELWPSD